MPSDKESYVCVADLKRKMRAYLRYRMSNDVVKRELLSIVERLPITVKSELETTLDDVSVVRCKDCKNRNSSKECSLHSDDYFCAFGERKEPEQDADK